MIKDMIVFQADAMAFEKVDRYRRWPRTVVQRSVLAGIYIALGALFMGLLKDYGFNKLIYSAGFSIGLFFVVTANGDLFTGNCLIRPFIEDNDDLRISSTEMLIVNFLGNLSGVIFILVLVFNLSDINLQVFADIAKAKCDPNLTIPELFIKGFLCNFLVCLGVWMSSYTRQSSSTLSKFVSVLIPVTVFIFCGFEHCIANMFFLPFGILLNEITFGQIIIQLGVVTIGNWIGGRTFGFFMDYVLLGDRIDIIRASESNPDKDK